MGTIIVAIIVIGTAWLAYKTSQMVEEKKQHGDVVIFRADETWTVHDTTFAGKEAERFANQYAQELIGRGLKADVKLPGCEPEDARNVWDLN